MHNNRAFLYSGPGGVYLQLLNLFVNTDCFNCWGWVRQGLRGGTFFAVVALEEIGENMSRNPFFFVCYPAIFVKRASCVQRPRRG